MDEAPCCSAVIDVQQGVVQALVDDALGLVLLLALSDEHHGDAALAHDGTHVCVVDIDERGFRDRFADTLDGLRDELIHDRERLAERQVRHELDETVVVEDDDRVGSGRELLKPLFRAEESGFLDLEGIADHADDDRPLLLCYLRDDRRRPRAGSTAHAGRDEDKVRIAEQALEGRPGHLGCAPADVREPAGPKAFGERFSDKHPLVGLDHVQVLFVRVDRDRLCTTDLHVVKAVDGIVACPAASYDDNPWLAEEIVLCLA